MYYLANLIVSRVGLSETIILIVAGGLGFVYLLLARVALRFDGFSSRYSYVRRYLRYGFAIPILLAILGAVDGSRDFSHDMNLLQQTGAITRPQFLAMREHHYFGVGKLVFVGAASTFALWVLMSRLNAVDVAAPSEPASAAAGKEKDAEPV